MNNVSHLFSPLRSTADIPNQAGLRISGLDKALGRRVPLLVAKDAQGLHHLTNLDGTRRSVTEFSGWYPEKP